MKATGKIFKPKAKVVDPAPSEEIIPQAPLVEPIVQAPVQEESKLGFTTDDYQGDPTV
jgi:hypothetical protein